MLVAVAYWNETARLHRAKAKHFKHTQYGSWPEHWLWGVVNNLPGVAKRTLSVAFPLLLLLKYVRFADLFALAMLHPLDVCHPSSSRHLPLICRRLPPYASIWTIKSVKRTFKPGKHNAAYAKTYSHKGITQTPTMRLAMPTFICLMRGIFGTEVGH